MDFLRDLRSIRLPPQPYLDRGHAIPYLPIDRSKVFSIIFYLCQEVKKGKKHCAETGFFLRTAEGKRKRSVEIKQSSPSLPL